jgi:serine/threonine protein kinase
MSAEWKSWCQSSIQKIQAGYHGQLGPDWLAGRSNYAPSTIERYLMPSGNPSAAFVTRITAELKSMLTALEQAEANRRADDEARRRAVEELARQQAAEAEMRRRAAEAAEAKKRADAAEAARKAAQDAAAKRRADEEAAAIEAARRKAVAEAEEQARRCAADAERERRGAVEAAEAKQRDAALHTEARKVEAKQRAEEAAAAFKAACTLMTDAEVAKADEEMRVRAAEVEAAQRKAAEVERAKQRKQRADATEADEAAAALRKAEAASLAKANEVAKARQRVTGEVGKSIKERDDPPAPAPPVAVLASDFESRTFVYRNAGDDKESCDNDDDNDELDGDSDDSDSGDNDKDNEDEDEDEKTRKSTMKEHVPPNKTDKTHQKALGASSVVDSNYVLLRRSAQHITREALGTGSVGQVQGKVGSLKLEPGDEECLEIAVKQLATDKVDVAAALEAQRAAAQTKATAGECGCCVAGGNAAVAVDDLRRLLEGDNVRIDAVRERLLVNLARAHQSERLIDDKFWRERVLTVWQDPAQSERSRLERCLKVLRGDDLFPSDDDIKKLCKIEKTSVSELGTITNVGCVVKLAKYDGALVAVKTLSLKDNERENSCLRREIYISSRVSHPNCARMIGCYKVNCDFFLLSDFIGPTLLKVLERIASRLCGLPGPQHLVDQHFATAASGGFVCHAIEGDPQFACLSTLLDQLPFDLVKRYVLDAARGLQYLHSLDIAHRDFGPHNLCITMDGERAVIIDFGSSKENHHAIKSAFVPTKRPYASPEVFAHNMQPINRVWTSAEECAADIYTLGMTLAHCLVPHHAYWRNAASNPTEFVKIRYDVLVADQLHGKLTQIFNGSLHEDWSKRISISEFAADLRQVPQVLNDAAVQTKPWRDLKGAKLPPLFQLNALPNLYLRGPWPDGTEARHGDVAFLGLRGLVAAHQRVCITCKAILPERLSALRDEDIPLLSGAVSCMFVVEKDKRDKADLIKNSNGIAVAWLRCRRVAQIVDESDLSAVKGNVLQHLNACFWVDQFGNLISPLASNGSLAHADVDHVFPHSLGGVSAQLEPSHPPQSANKLDRDKFAVERATALSKSNVIMLHERANRYIKSDTVLQFIRPSLMQTGVTVGFVLDQIIAAKAPRLVPLLVGFDPLTDSSSSKWVTNATQFGLPTLKSMADALKTLAELEQSHKKL